MQFQFGAFFFYSYHPRSHVPYHPYPLEAISTIFRVFFFSAISPVNVTTRAPSTPTTRAPRTPTTRAPRNQGSRLRAWSSEHGSWLRAPRNLRARVARVTGRERRPRGCSSPWTVGISPLDLAPSRGIKNCPLPPQ